MATRKTAPRQNKQPGRPPKTRSAAKAGTAGKLAASRSAGGEPVVSGHRSGSSSIAPQRTARAPGQDAPRIILLFADGTGNSSRSAAKSNVWRLYQALDVGPDNTGYSHQISHYIDGVGTSSFKWIALIGQAFGFGLARRIKGLYEFLCRHYRPGDHIYIFGFSRGAFTARVLAHLIAKCGILDLAKPAPHRPDLTMDQEEGFKLGVREAYRSYRHEYWRKASPHLNLLNAVWERIGSIWRNTLGSGEPFHSTMSFREAYSHLPVDADGERAIRMLGVWDTVDAYGVPVREIADFIDTFLYPYQFPDRDLGPLVARAAHALSLDDKRETFHPLLWNEHPSPVFPVLVDRPNVTAGMRNLSEWIRPDPVPASRTENAELELQYDSETERRTGSTGRDSRIQQVWFPGMHADVGGGYPEPGLSMIALDWMIQQTAKAAALAGKPLQFKGDHIDEIRSSAEATAHIHDSRGGFAAIFRYKPRDIETLCGQNNHNAMVKVTMPRVHQAVLDRIREERVGYAPLGLPSGFSVAQWDISHADNASGESDTDARMALQHRAGSHVFWRILNYFLMLFCLIVLLAMPLLENAGSLSALFAGHSASPGNGFSALMIWLKQTFTAFPFSLLRLHFDAWARAPDLSLILIVTGLASLFWSSGFVQPRVQRFAEAALFFFKDKSSPAALPAPGVFERFASWVRGESPVVLFLADTAKNLLLMAIPLIAFGILSLVAFAGCSLFGPLLWGLIAIVSGFWVTLFSPAVLAVLAAVVTVSMLWTLSR